MSATLRACLPVVVAVVCVVAARPLNIAGQVYTVYGSGTNPGSCAELTRALKDADQKSLSSPERATALARSSSAIAWVLGYMTGTSGNSAMDQVWRDVVLAAMESGLVRPEIRAARQAYCALTPDDPLCNLFIPVLENPRSPDFKPMGTDAVISRVGWRCQQQPSATLKEIAIKLLSELRNDPSSPSADNSRNRSTPSSRIVGHWTTGNITEATHYYFGSIDPATDTGSLIWVEKGGEGRVVKHRYKVIAEIPKGEELSLQILFGAGGSRVDPYVVATHGLTMTSEPTIGRATIKESYNYIDTRVAPE